ncbi:MAG: chorismate synthase [Oscillospiraceae bacterium]|nr:chorismate synthase [Oscillospiraceae bacterium]
MGSIWGNKLKISIFGESHGDGVGVVIDGFSAGFEVDFDYINKFLKRRAPGNNLSTSRIESDTPEILSGIKNNFTTGAPICAFIKNNNAHSSDYQDKSINPRPSHADYNAYVKYHGYSDQRGGGHFSGRLTAPLVFAGALCSDWLNKNYNIKINARLKQVGDIKITNVGDGVLDVPPIPTQIEEFILKLKETGDSVGAIIECIADNVPQGLGEHIFSSVEANISSCIFGIPGIKGIEFGKGFEFASMRGSEANDEYYYDNNGEVKTKTNNNGGIIGGITTGMPVIFSVVFKPTPSIFLEQDTINLETKTNDKIKIKGRHDPCIGIRAVPIVEAAAAVALTDLIL